MPSRINMGPDGGPYIAINENSGNIELEDNTGTTVAIWDDANSQWDFQNNPISNVDSLTSNSLNTDELSDSQILKQDDDATTVLDNTPPGSVVYVAGANATHTLDNPTVADGVTIIAGDVTFNKATGAGACLTYGDYFSIYGSNIRFEGDSSGVGLQPADVEKRYITLTNVSINDFDKGLEMTETRGFNYNTLRLTNNDIGIELNQGSIGDNSRFGSGENLSIANNRIGVLIDGARNIRLEGRWRDNTEANVEIRGGSDSVIREIELSGDMGSVDGSAVFINSQSPSMIRLLLQNVSFSASGGTNAPPRMTGDVAQIHAEGYNDNLQIICNGGNYVNNNNGFFFNDPNQVNNARLEILSGNGNAQLKNVRYRIASDFLPELQPDAYQGFTLTIDRGYSPYIANSSGARIYVGGQSDVTTLSPSTHTIAINNGTTGTQGPVYYNGTNWVSLIDGTII